MNKTTFLYDKAKSIDDKKVKCLKGHWTSLTSIFLYNSKEDIKSTQYQIFKLILPMRLHFMRDFVISIIFRLSHRLLYCVFIEVDFEK